MDFSAILQKSQGKDSLLMVMDRPIKYAKPHIIQNTYIANHVVEEFMKEIN